MMSIDEVKNILEEAFKNKKYDYITESDLCVITDTLDTKTELKYDYDTGASKLVLLIEDFDYVVKIPFFGSFCEDCERYNEETDEYEYIEDYFSYEYGGGVDGNDYCALEEEKYEEIDQYIYGMGEEYEVLKNFFAKTEYLCSLGGIPAYIQPKCDSFFNNSPSNKSREDARDLKARLSQASSKNPDDFSPFNIRFMADILDRWGADIMDALDTLIDELHITDLHSGNIGYYNGYPVIYDYSGFENQGVIMRDRGIICKYYTYKGGPCDKRGISVSFMEECRTCKFYTPIKNGKNMKPDTRQEKKNKFLKDRRNWNE